MNIHQNARLTPFGREWLVRQMESGQTPEAAARAAGVCPRTARDPDVSPGDAICVDVRGEVLIGSVLAPRSGAGRTGLS